MSTQPENPIRVELSIHPERFEEIQFILRTVYEWILEADEVDDAQIRASIDVFPKELGTLVRDLQIFHPQYLQILTQTTEFEGEVVKIPMIGMITLKEFKHVAQSLGLNDRLYYRISSLVSQDKTAAAGEIPAKMMEIFDQAQTLEELQDLYLAYLQDHGVTSHYRNYFYQIGPKIFTQLKQVMVQIRINRNLPPR